jgi:hypothetical protein
MFSGSVLVLSCVAARLRIAGLAIHWKPVGSKASLTKGTKRGIDEVSSILRTVARHRGRRLSVYVGVACEGSIPIGDDILVASSDPSN